MDVNNLSESEVTYLLDKEVQNASSSNVSQYQYLFDANMLLIRYNSGGYYQYSDITPEEALSFYHAPSKGRWVAMYLKGPVGGVAKKPYAKIA